LPTLLCQGCVFGVIRFEQDILTPFQCFVQYRKALQIVVAFFFYLHHTGFPERMTNLSVEVNVAQYEVNVLPLEQSL
jgi:hypothetical protein